MSERRVVLQGITGSGKSALGNLLTGKNSFATSNNVSSETCGVNTDTVTLNGVNYMIIDTVGLNDTSDSQVVVRSKITDGVKACAHGVDVFLLVVRMDRFKDDDALAFEYLMSAILGAKSYDNAILIITHAPSDFAVPNGGPAKEIEWLEKAKEHENFYSIVRAVNHRVHFICNPPVSNSTDPDEQTMEEINKKRRQYCVDKLVQTITQFNVPPYTIDQITQAQSTYDEELRKKEEELKQAQEAEKQKIRDDMNAMKDAHDKQIQEFLASQAAKDRQAQQQAEQAQQQVQQAQQQAQQAQQQAQQAQQQAQQAQQEAQQAQQHTNKKRGFWGKLGAALDSIF